MNENGGQASLAAIGFRNPYRMSFDMDADGRPLIDPIIEYQNANAEGGLGLVVIGGNVYRAVPCPRGIAGKRGKTLLVRVGSAMPAWDGFYIFGDWSASFLRADGTLLVATLPAAAGGM